MSEKTEKIAPKFQIGDPVWRASSGTVEKWVTCPDCGGTRTLKATLFDGTEYNIECVGCAAGYNPPCGQVRLYEFGTATHWHTVTGVTIGEGGCEYRLSGSYWAKEEDLLATREEAELRAEVLAKERADEQHERFTKKEKDTRSWAWHVHYHRREAAESQRRLEYHTAKLGIAKAKAKETKAA